MHHYMGIWYKLNFVSISIALRGYYQLHIQHFIILIKHSLIRLLVLQVTYLLLYNTNYISLLYQLHLWTPIELRWYINSPLYRFSFF